MWALFWYIVTTIAIEFLRPKAKMEKPPRAGLSDFSFPTTDETRAVAVVFGTVKTTPAQLWMGDYGYSEITKKIRTGLFSKDNMVLGYRYKLGQQFALCHGAIDALVGIWVGEKKAWSGQVLIKYGYGDYVQSWTDTPPAGAKTLDFSYEYQQSEGSEYNERVAGTLEIAGGPYVSPYLTAQLGDGNVPAYPHLTTVVWRGPSASGSNTIGTSSTPSPVYFEVRRLPDLVASGFIENDGLNETNAWLQSINDTSNINGDANPAWIIAEVLTNKRWGAGIHYSYMDRASFFNCAQTLFNEGHGASFIWETQQAVSGVLDQMLSQINGVLDVDHTAGCLRLRLIRENQDPVLEISPSNIREGGFKSFSRASIDEATNSVRVPFIDRAAGYVERQAEAQDLGAIAQANTIISIVQSYIGVTNATLANTLALRDARTSSGSLAKCSVDVIMQKGQLVSPGDVVLLNWPPLGISNMKMRVLTSKYAQGFSAVVTLDLMQDIFTAGTAVYSSPIPPLEVPNVSAPTRAAWGRVFVAPVAMTTDSVNRRLLFACGAPADGSASNYTLGWWNGAEDRTEANIAFNDSAASSFAAKASAIADMGTGTGSVWSSFTDTDKATAFKTANQSVIGVIGDEFVKAHVESGGFNTYVVLEERGLFGTTATAFPAGTEIVLLYGYAIDSAPLGVTGTPATVQADSYALAITKGPGGTLNLDAQGGTYDAHMAAGTLVG